MKILGTSSWAFCISRVQHFFKQMAFRKAGTPFIRYVLKLKALAITEELKVSGFKATWVGCGKIDLCLDDVHHLPKTTK